MRRLGLEFYVAPLPKKRRTGDTKSERLLDGDVNWLRVPMYEAIAGQIALLDQSERLKGKKAVELGGSEGTILNVLKERGVVTEVAPDYPVIDIEEIPFPDDSYDILVIDQVLEHVRHPWIATREIRRVLRDSGICLCTSVLVYPVHKGFVGSFGDYFRFSPDGYASVFEGFKILSADGWGNSEVMRLVYSRSERGPEGAPPVSKREAKEAGLYDSSDGMNLLMTWCVAQKAR